MIIVYMLKSSYKNKNDIMINIQTFKHIHVGQRRTRPAFGNA